MNYIQATKDFYIIETTTYIYYRQTIDYLY